MLKKIDGVVREFGLGAGMLYLLDRALRALPGRCGLYVYEMMVQPTAGKALLPERLARNISFREIEADDPVVQRMPARPEIKDARYARGARCLGVERKGELLGYIWLSFDAYEEDEVRCTYCLPQRQDSGLDSVFDFDLYVFPEHRMGIAFVAIWHAASAYLRGLGVRGSHSRMTRFNLASRRAHLRLGSVVTGRAVFLQLGAVECMASTLHPFVALTWSPSRRVRLRLPALPMAAEDGAA